MGGEVPAALNPVEAVFKRRLNRFNTLVEVDGSPAEAFLPNSGRLRELLTPGRKVILDRPSSHRRRKTRFTLVGVVLPGGVKVSVDARLPSRLIAEAAAEGLLQPFQGFQPIQPEPYYGGSRLDLLLEDGAGRRLIVEVKSCTLAAGRVAMFPDAPTARGRRQLKALTRAVEEGLRAAIVFLAQRSDVDVFTPNASVDPAFTAALREAVGRGVEAYAYKAEFTGRSLRLLAAIPVWIPAGK